jgi:hypothetical protein
MKKIILLIMIGKKNVRSFKMYLKYEIGLILVLFKRCRVLRLFATDLIILATDPYLQGILDIDLCAGAHIGR